MTSDFIEKNKTVFEGDRVTREAFLIARRAHEGQVRKYTGEPFVEHPIRVALRLHELGEGPHTLAAALLHDVVEDTVVTADELSQRLPDEVVSLVLEVTNPECPTCKNRRARKEKCREHLFRASARGQTLKYSDVLDNIESIAMHDPRFAPTYLMENQSLVEVLTKGREDLREQVVQRIEDLLLWVPSAKKAIRDAERLGS